MLGGPQGARSRGSQSIGASKDYWFGPLAPDPPEGPLSLPNTILLPNNDTYRKNSALHFLLLIGLVFKFVYFGSAVEKKVALLCIVSILVLLTHMRSGLAAWETIHDFLIFLWDHWLWLCVSEAVLFKCCFPLEPKPFSGLTVGDISVDDRPFLMELITRQNSPYPECWYKFWTNHAIFQFSCIKNCMFNIILY